MAVIRVLLNIEAAIGVVIVVGVLITGIVPVGAGACLIVNTGDRNCFVAVFQIDTTGDAPFAIVERWKLTK